MVKIKITDLIKIFLLVCFLVFGQQALASMESDNFKFWVDDLNSGGGAFSSTNYKMNSNLSGVTGEPAVSNNFNEAPGFSAIENEPTVGFAVQTVNLDFGQLSPATTAYSSHTFSAYTNSASGYTVRVYGESLNNVNYTLQEIGATPLASSPGNEQFGINLTTNTMPVVGALPDGPASAGTNYATPNEFAYDQGDVVAQSESYSFQTNFTVSVIINIAEDTPAGVYSTMMTYEFIPVF